MRPLLAELHTHSLAVDDRSAVRRTLCLEVEASTSEHLTKARIHNLSETGLLIEAAPGLSVGDMVEVSLPLTDGVSATVIWVDGPYLGCEFERPVSRAVVSASVLRSPPGHFHAADVDLDATHHSDLLDILEIHLDKSVHVVGAGKFAFISSVVCMSLFAILFVSSLYQFTFTS